MKEGLKPQFAYSPYEFSDNSEATPDKLRMSVVGGVYHDPTESYVDYLNDHYSDPAIVAREALIRSFELAEIIKPKKEVAGTLLSTELEGSSTDDILVVQRDKKAGREFSSDEDDLNYLHIKVVNRLNRWRQFDEGQQDELWQWGKKFTRDSTDVPEVLKIISVMAGRRRAEKSGQYFSKKITSEAYEFATAAYWMMLREELEASKDTQTSEDVA